MRLQRRAKENAEQASAKDVVEQVADEAASAVLHPEVIDDGDDPTETVRELVMATYKHDRDARVLLAEALDADDWKGASLLLAAAKQVAVERHRKEIEKQGLDSWVQSVAHDAVRRHQDWMRLRHGQIAAMLRSALGDHDLAFALPADLRGRLDATVLEHLIAMRLAPWDSFTEELGDVLAEAERLASLRTFIEEFER